MPAPPRMPADTVYVTISGLDVATIHHTLTHLPGLAGGRFFIPGQGWLMDAWAVIAVPRVQVGHRAQHWAAIKPLPGEGAASP